MSTPPPDVPLAPAILSEIHSETLQNLFVKLRYQTLPPGSTNIPSLDSYLMSSGKHVSPLASLNRADVIEVQGPPASGKSHFVLYLLITCILQPHHQSTVLGGWGKSAVLFDNDDTFDVKRFKQLLTSRLLRLLPSSPTRVISDLTRDCLSRLHIFRPASSTQLAATLLHLPAYHSDCLLDEEIGMIAVDSVSAFYWPDRFIVESSADRYTTSPLYHVVYALEQLRSSIGAVVVLTNWGLHNIHASDRSSPAQFYRQHLRPFPNPFVVPRFDASSIRDTSATPLAITHHITFPFVSLPQVPAGVRLPEVSQCNEQREERVEKGEVVGLIRTPGQTSVGRFLFYITSDDILPGKG